MSEPGRLRYRASEAALRRSSNIELVNRPRHSRRRRGRRRLEAVPGPVQHLRTPNVSQPRTEMVRAAARQDLEGRGLLQLGANSSSRPHPVEPPCLLAHPAAVA